MKKFTRVTRIILHCFFLCIIVMSQLTLSGQNLNKYKSKIESLSSKLIPVKIGEKDTLLYLNEVSSRLKKNDTVYIVGHGYLSGIKKFNFFSNDSNIVVKRNSLGLDSITIAIKNRSTVQGVISLLDFPSENEIPESYSEIEIADSKKFDERLQVLIKKYFLIGSKSYEQGGIIIKMTSYTDLNTNDRNQFGQIAIFISQPFVINKKTYCHISYKARESRSGSKKWREAESRVQAIAKIFFGNFLKEL